LAAGPGKLHPHTGVRIVNPVKPGDSVVFGKFDGVQLSYNDDVCQMIRDDDVMLIYEGSSIMSLNNVRPCRDYVLVELDSMGTGETTSGIVLAAAVMKDQVPCEGTVMKVGEGRMTSTGDFANPPVAIGDRIKFKDYGGNDVLIGGKPYSVVRMVDILCTIGK
jgi:chaperonin GroES